MKQFLAILMLLVVLLQACGPTPSPTPEKIIEIVFYKRGYVEGGEDSATLAIVNAVKAFESRNPSIRVKVVGISYGLDGDTILDEALKNREDVHVVSMYPAKLPEYARAGYLSPIDEYLTEEDRADFYESALQAASVDGKIYAWPLWVTAVAMYANPQIFAERGVEIPTLDAPWTWAEFVAAAEELTYQKEDGTQVYGFSASSKPGVVVYLPFFYIDGGRTLSPDGRRFVQNELQAVTALQKVADLHLVHKVTPPDFGNVDQIGIRAQFEAGTLAIAMETPSFIPDMQAKNVAFVPFPVPTGDLGLTVTSGAFGMYSVITNPDPQKVAAAHLFAKYLTSAEVAGDVPNYQLAPGLRRSNSAYATDDARAIISRLVSFGVFEPPVSIPNELNEKYQIALQSILLGEKTAQEAMNDIAPEYQQALDNLSP